MWFLFLRDEGLYILYGINGGIVDVARHCDGFVVDKFNATNTPWTSAMTGFPSDGKLLQLMDINVRIATF